MVQVTINLYSIHELEKAVQDEIIANHKEFLVSVYRDGDFDPSFNMTRSKYARSLTRSDIIGNITVNEYLYFKNGEMADICQYIQGAFPNPKAGTTEFKLNGETYTYKTEEL